MRDDLDLLGRTVYKAWKYGEQVTVDDPWGCGDSLEWATLPAAPA